MPPERWYETELGKVVVPEHGLQTGPFGSQLHASDYVADGIPVIMPRDLAGNVISSANVARVSAEKAAQLERYRFRPGDIVLARRGKIGRCALVTSDEDGWLCGTGCLRARLAPSVDPEFVFQLLQWPATATWMKENAVGQTMQNLNTRIFASLPIRVPPLPEQKKIAAILRSVEASVDATRRVIEQTVTVKEGFARHLLTRGVSHRTDQRAAGGKRLPAGWQRRSIGELCTFVSGHGFKAADWAAHGLPIIRIKNLNGSREFKYYAGRPKDRWIVDAGELVFAWAGVKGVSFGPRIWPGPQGVLNQHIYRIRPNRDVAKAWLFDILRLVTRNIEERAQGFKSSLLHVRKADITDQMVPVPPLAEQKAIAGRSSSVSEMQAIEQSHLESQLKLKNALMGDLFTGRVSVADRAPGAGGAGGPPGG